MTRPTTPTTPLGRATVIATVLSILSLAAFGGSAGADTKGQIDATRRRIQTLIDRMGSQAAEIDRLESEASDLAAQINGVLSEISAAEARVAELQTEIEGDTREMADLQSLLDARAREVYVQGAGSQLELLLGSSSYEDFTSKLEFIDRAAESDRDLFDEIENHTHDLIDKQEELEQLQLSLRDRQAELASQGEAVSAKLDRARDLYASIRADRAEAESLLEQLEDRAAREAEEARLAELARRQAQQQQLLLQQQQQGGNGPLFACPVDQPRAYSNDFGMPRPGGRTHQGNDIFAPYGTPIRAPFPGRAVAGSNDLGGLTVHVFGGAGFVYNAHLSAYGQTGSVSTGTVIGYVGTSGNAQGKAPHDHFEWHPGNGAAVNPFPYLNEVC